MAHLIAFSHLRWDFVFQRPQHLLTRIAQRHPVIYIEEPVFSTGPAHLALIQVAPQVEVLRPHTPLNEHGYTGQQIELIRPLLRDHLKRRQVTEAFAWFYTPMAWPLLSSVPHQAVAYDCMDELSAFKGAPQQMKEQEAALLKRADLVFTGGLSLYDAKRNLHPHVHCQPSAVDVAHYAPSRLKPGSDLARRAQALQGHLPGPRLGYFGVIDERMNLGLIEALADARQDWSIVMVGPVSKIDPAQLPRRANVTWLGQQPYELLPYLVAEWDVCLMPFALNEATQYISPTKTLEYLAAEKPVVSTAIRDVVALYGEVVHVAHNRSDFIETCLNLVAGDSDRFTAENAAGAGCVSCLSWDDTAQAMLDLLHQAARRRAQARPLPSGLATAGAFMKAR